ncbi:MAG: hypothetical protein ACLS9H_08335 [Dialister sp.]
MFERYTVRFDGGITDTQIIEGNKKYTEEEIVINVKGKYNAAGFKAEDDERQCRYHRARR